MKVGQDVFERNDAEEVIDKIDCQENDKRNIPINSSESSSSSQEYNEITPDSVLERRKYRKSMIKEGRIKSRLYDKSSDEDSSELDNVFKKSDHTNKSDGK